VSAVSFTSQREFDELKQDYLQIRVLELAPQVYASGQLFESDLQLVAGQGVRSIVNTRPDNESAGQPSSADLAKAAEQLGIVFVHLPVDPGSITREEAETFMKTCDELERPLVVCGRSGGQSTKIWETAESM
jgi:sulfide:quinone oxidoreductase